MATLSFHRFIMGKVTVESHSSKVGLYFYLPLAHLPITRMRNRGQYGKSIRQVAGLALEESQMNTLPRIYFL